MRKYKAGDVILDIRHSVVRKGTLVKVTGNECLIEFSDGTRILEDFGGIAQTELYVHSHLRRLPECIKEERKQAARHSTKACKMQAEYDDLTKFLEERGW